MTSDSKKILSLDGGGVRGVITASLLTYVEDELLQMYDQTLYEYFDIIAGTSSGSMIAAGLISGKSAQQILDEFMSELPNVFWDNRKLIVQLERSLGLKVFGSSFGILRARYSGDSFKEFLRGKFQSCHKDSGIDKLMIFAFDIKRNKPMIFFQPEISDFKDSNFGFHIREFNVWEAVLCSSSCPALFPAYELFHDDTEFLVVDGSIGGFNPALHASSVISSNHKNKVNLEVLSVGSGNPLSSRPKSVKNWGMLKWSSKLFDLLTFGSYEINDLSTYLIANKFLRLQPNLHCFFGKKSINRYYDDASIRNIESLVLASKNYMQNQNNVDSIKKFFANSQNQAQ